MLVIKAGVYPEEAKPTNGPVAQLARALPWHGRG